MTRNCATCRYFKLHTQIRTPLEIWQEDDRPERPKGFIGAMRWLWCPATFKDPKPGTSDDPFEVMLAKLREEDTKSWNESGACRRFPKSQRVHRNYGCGEYAAKLPA